MKLHTKKKLVLFSLVNAVLSISTVAQKASINVKFDETFTEDTLFALVYNTNFLPLDIERQITHTKLMATKKNEQFQFFIKNDSAVYLTIRSKKSTLLTGYFIEKGDSVTINFINSTVKFSGNGSQKYQVKYLLDSLYRDILYGPGEIQKQTTSKYPIVTSFISVFQNRNKLLLVLNSYRNKLSQQAYCIQYSNLVGKVQLGPIMTLRACIDLQREYSSKDVDTLRRYISEYLIDLAHIADSCTSLSYEYLSYLYNYGQLKQSISKLNGPKESYFDFFKMQFNGPVKEKLLTAAVLFAYNFLKNPDSLINDVLTELTSEYYKQKIKATHANQKKGHLAFNFTLPNEFGDTIKLSDFRNKIVFLDFWFVGCSPCKFYYKNAISVAEEHFQNDSNVVFISIAVQKDKESWIKAVNSGSYSSKQAINLLVQSSDFNHIVTKSYSVSSAPRPFLIDRNGLIFSANSNELGNTIAANPKKLIETIERAIKANAQ